MYRIEVRHEGLKKYRVITGADRRIVEQKARLLEAEWDVQWLTIQCNEAAKEIANKLTKTAQSTIAELERILIAVLERPRILEWNKLKSDTFLIKPPLYVQ